MGGGAKNLQGVKEFLGGQKILRGGVKEFLGAAKDF